MAQRDVVGGSGDEVEDGVKVGRGVGDVEAGGKG